MFNDKEINKVSLFEYYSYTLYFYISLILFLIKYNFISVEQNSLNFMNLLKLGGPLFIKIGQNIANKKNIDATLKKYLKSLQSKNFNSNIASLDYINNNYTLEYIENKPIASGSIASIYNVKYQDKNCILKILHTNIRKETIKSINLFESIKKWIINNDLFNYFKQLVKLEQIYKELLDQTDLRNEVFNLKEIKNNFSDKSFSDLIIFPDIYYFDKNIIIESYLDGYEILDFIKKYPKRKEEASHLIHCVFYKMFFDNCIHADMHFSNIRFKLDDNRVKIILFDFGLVSRITNVEDYKTFINVYKKNMFSPDINKFVEMMIKFNLNPDANTTKFRNEIHQFLKDNKMYENLDCMNKGIKLKNEYVNTTEIIKSGLELATKNKLVINDYAFNICNGFILLDDYNVEISDNNSLLVERYEYANTNGFISDMTSCARELFRNK